MQNFYLFCKKKNLLPYFTHPFLQNTHISFSILHIYSIEYSLFYNFLLFPHYPSLSHTQHYPTINPHPPSTHLATINEINHHHQPTRPPSSSNQPPLSTHPLSSKKAKYPKTHSIRPDQPKYPKPHST